MAIRFDKKSEGVYTLDCRGYVCPHPQIYTKKMLEKIRPGDVLELTFDNPSSAESINAMCAASGNCIIEAKSEGGKYFYRIKRA